MLFFMIEHFLQWLLRLQYRTRIRVHQVDRMYIFYPLIHRIYLVQFLDLAFLCLFD